METFVVPRYLAFFGELALEMFLAGEGARVAHLGCRTGYPDRQLYEATQGASVVGIDDSAAALELARNKVATLGEVPIEYLEVHSLPADLPEASFSHAISLHPIGSSEERAALYREMYRLLYGGGQALLAVPLRGSFQELGDLLREYALKFDDGELSSSVEAAIVSRHTLETLADEIESAGLDDVDVEIRQTTLSFDSGRAFMEDPVTRLLVVPEVQSWLPDTDLTKPWDYVRDAIDKYWSEGRFELSLNVGCASSRKYD